MLFMPTPSRAEMMSTLKSLGLSRRYKPYWDGESDYGSICLETRKFFIVNGELDGSQMDLMGDRVVRVWTSQKKKASTIATQHKFSIRLFDGEAELLIPVSRADEFLHGLGAKVRANRTLTPEQAAAGAARLVKARQAKKEAKATAS